MIDVNGIKYTNPVPQKGGEFEKARMFAAIYLLVPIICAAVLLIGIQQNIIVLLIVGIALTAIWVILVIHKIISMLRMPVRG